MNYSVKNIPFQLDIPVDPKEYPVQSTPGSIGYDLFAQEDVLVPSYPLIMRHFITNGRWECPIEDSPFIDYESPIFTTLIPLNIHVEYPEGSYSFLMARSSLAKKKGLILTNSVGLIDTDYRDNHRASVINFSPTNVLVKKGEKIAQLVLMDKTGAQLQMVKQINLKSDHKGFGGTGGYKADDIPSTAKADYNGPELVIMNNGDEQLYLNFEGGSK